MEIDTSGILTLEQVQQGVLTLEQKVSEKSTKGWDDVLVMAGWKDWSTSTSPTTAQCGQSV